jgi:hypothetical protein
MSKVTLLREFFLFNDEAADDHPIRTSALPLRADA